MRRSSTLILASLLLFISTAGAQSTIDRLEYFFNTDPGAGAGTDVPISAGASLNESFTISTASLSDGFHRLYVRCRFDDGRWGLAEMRSFYLFEPPGSPTTDIEALEYFFDTDPGVGNGEEISVAPGASVSSAINLSTGSLGAGFHRLFVRARFVDGRWGTTEVHPFYLYESSSYGLPQDIVAAEVFFDTDPGVGNGTPVSIGSPAQSINTSIAVTVPALPLGTHYLYLRVQFANGDWSLVERAAFEVENVVTCYADDDDDTYGDPNDSQVFPDNCGAGYVDNDDDCNDNCADCYPGASEICDGFDNDCNSQVDEGGICCPTAPGVAYFNDFETDNWGMFEEIVGGNWQCYDSLIGQVALSTEQFYQGAKSLRVWANQGNSVFSNHVIAQHQLCSDGLLDQYRYRTWFYIPDLPDRGETGPEFSVQSTRNVGGTNLTHVAGIQYVNSPFAANKWKVWHNGNWVNIPTALFNPTFAAEAWYMLEMDFDLAANAYLSLHVEGNGLDVTLPLNQPFPGAPGGYLIAGETRNFSPATWLTLESENLWSNCGTAPEAPFNFRMYYDNVELTDISNCDPEICDGLDNDCDSDIDDGVLLTFYEDADDDGFGNAAESTQTCAAPPGYVSNDDDCNDNQLRYADGDSDTYGSTTFVACGGVTNDDDCNDGNSAVHPGATEICNANLDDDCNGLADLEELPAPVAAISGDLEICANQSTTLTGSGGVSCAWSTGASTCPITVNPTASTAYTLTVTDANGCTDQETVTVTVLALPEINIYSPDLELCLGESTTLLVSGGESYVWSTGATTDEISASPTVSTTYSVTATGFNGCTKVLSETVTVAPPVAAGISPDGFFCSGAQVVLTASGGDAYEWSTGETTSEITVTVGGEYFVTVTETATGCSEVLSTVQSDLGLPPNLTFAGDLPSGNFDNSIVVPQQGNPYTRFDFKVNYQNQEFPDPGYPRLQLDYDGDGDLDDPLDRTFVMTPIDDAYPEYGKIYFADIIGLEPGENWTVSVVATSNGGAPGCAVTLDDLEGPDVRDELDIHLFANDISFSNSNPDPGEAFTVTVAMHNDSDEDALGFTVRLENQYSNEVWTQAGVDLFAHEIKNVTFTVNAPNSVSWDPMAVTLDFGNSLAEFNELNNFAIRPVTVGSFVLPGGISVTAAAQPNPAFFSSDSPPSPVTILGKATYFGTGTSADDSGVAGASVEITITETGQTFSLFSKSDGTFRLEFVPPAQEGTYNFTGTITDYTVEGYFTGSFELIEVGIPEIDFRVSATFSPQQPYLSYFYDPVGQIYRLTTLENSTVNATFTVTNGGSDAATQETVLSVYCPNASPTNYLTFTVPPLVSGGSYTTSLQTFTFENYGYSVLAAVCDATGIYWEGEKGERNNFADPSLAIRVLKALPDLTPFPINSNNGNGNAFFFECQLPGSHEFKVWNKGGFESPGFDVEMEFEKDGQSYFFTETFPAIPFFGGATVNFDNISLPEPGTYNLTVRTDVPYSTLGQVIEWKENNNTWTGTATVAACQADLRVFGFHQNVQPVDPQHPGFLDVTVPVQNSGLDDIATTVDVRFRTITPSGTTDQIVTLPNGLAQGEMLNLLATIPTPPHGDNSLEVKIDPDNDYPESQEFNNQESVALCWNFSLSNLEGIPGAIEQAFAPVVTLGNDGAYKASSVAVHFEISGTGISGWHDLGTAVLNGMNGYASSLVTAPSSYSFAQSGLYTFRITADPADSYTECDEADNVLEETYEVTNLPDLFIASYHVSPSKLNPEPGEPITVNLSYTNVGNDNTGEVFTIGLEADDVLISTTPGIGLETDDNWTVAMPGTYSSSVVGMHILRGIVDLNDEVAEADEFNNEATRAIFVGQFPNLFIESIVPDDPSPEVGQLLTLTVRVENEGDLACNADVVFTWNGSQPLTTVPVSVPAFSAGANGFYEFEIQWIVEDPNASIKGEITNATPTEYNSEDNELVIGLNAIAADVTTTATSCPESADGSATIAASGGEAPYNYVWSEPSCGNLEFCENLPAGTYSVSITDQANHQTTLTFEAPMTPDNQAPNITGESDLTVFAYEGVCPTPVNYPANWLPTVSDNCDPAPSFEVSPASGSTFAAGANTITFTVTDAYANEEIQTVTLTVTPLPTVFAGADQFVCTSATLLAAAPISSSFTVAEGTWEIISGTATLDPGDIHEPDAELSGIGNTPVVLRWTVTNGNCGSAFDEVVVTKDGTPPDAICRTFTVSLGANSQVEVTGETMGNDSEDNCFVDHFEPESMIFDCDDLGLNDVTVTVFDGAGNSAACVAHVTVEIGQGSCNECFADADDDTFGDAGNSQFFNGACPAGFVEDDTDCDDSDGGINPAATEIFNCLDDDCDGGTDENVPTLSFFVTEPNCHGDSDGSIDLSVGGAGSATLTFEWSNGETTEDISNLVAGTYDVSVTHPNGCTATATVEVGEPDPIEILSYDLSQVSCNSGSDGSIALTSVSGGSPSGAGGVGGYSYAWNVPDPDVPDDGDLFNLAAGDYSVSITDEHGCLGSADFEITQPDALSVSESISHVTCFGLENGSISLSASGGTPGYQFAWTSPGGTSNVLANLPAGIYDVSVTDANDCLKTGSYEVFEPEELVAEIVAVDSADCHGDANGSIDVAVSGGTLGYDYLWSNPDLPATTQDLTGLTAGAYSLIVSDYHDCTAEASATVFQPNALLLFANMDDVDCNGGNDGSIDLTVSGGSLGFTYVWTKTGDANFSATTQDLDDLEAGEYNIAVSDYHACEATASFPVGEPEALIATLQATDAPCPGGTGHITVSASGGIPLNGFYLYAICAGSGCTNFGNFLPDNVFSDLTEGTYTILVKDAHDCTFTAEATVNDPPDFVVNSSLDDVDCFGGSNGSFSVSVSEGGTPGYSFAICAGSGCFNFVGSQPEGLFENLSANTYSVRVHDSHNCVFTVTGTVSQPPALAASLAVDNVNCNGGEDGSITVSATGGVADYAYAICAGANCTNFGSYSASPVFENLSAGSYTISVKDAHDCLFAISTSVGEPPALGVTIAQSQTVVCEGGSVTLTATGNGGVPGYIFTWDNSLGAGATKTTTVLETTTYSVSATDSHGCEAVAEATVEAVPDPEIEVSGGQAFCASGSATLSVVATEGGTGTCGIQWQISSNGTTWTNIAGATGSTYFASVTATRYYRALYTCTGAGCNSAVSNQLALVVYPAITNNGISNPGTYNFCNSGNPGNMNGTTPGGGAGAGSYFYEWQSSLDGTTFTAIAGATNKNYDPPALAETTWFLRKVTSGACVSLSNLVKVTIVQDVTHTLEVPSLLTFCEATDPAVIDGNPLVPTPPGLPAGFTSVFSWQKKVNNGTWQAISGATAEDLDPDLLAQSSTTQNYRFRRSGSVKLGSINVCSDNSNVVHFTIYPLIGNNVLSLNQPQNTSGCSPYDPQTISGSQPGGGLGNNYDYQWQSSTDGTTFTNVDPPPSGTTKSYNPAAIEEDTWFRRRVTSGVCTDFSAAQAFAILELTNDIAPTGGTSFPTGGGNPALIDGSPMPALPSGYTGSFLWQKATNGGWSNATGSSTGEDYDPPSITVTTHFRRRLVVKDASNKTVCTLYSNEVTFTVGGNLVVPPGGEDAVAEIDEELKKAAPAAEMQPAQEKTGGFSLECLPNPTNGKTVVRFRLADLSVVRLTVLDGYGRPVEALATDDVLGGGEHDFEWNCVDCPSGIYFVRLQVNGQVETKRVILSKE